MSYTLIVDTRDAGGPVAAKGGHRGRCRCND